MWHPPACFSVTYEGSRVNDDDNTQYDCETGYPTAATGFVCDTQQLSAVH